MYGKVPLTLDAFSTLASDRVGPSKMLLPTCLAKPKSRTLTRPSEVMTIFAGLDLDEQCRGHGREPVRSRFECYIAEPTLARALRLCSSRRGLTLDQFHHDIKLPLILANFMNRADVGMSKGGRSARLVE